MTATNQIKVRAYGLKIGDFQTLNAWWRARHGTPFPENLAPPLGLVAESGGEPAGALFAYQALSIGVAFLEFGVTRPGTSFKLARQIMKRLLHGIILVLQANDYGLLRCFCETPAMERALKMFGFQGRNGNLYLLI